MVETAPSFYVTGGTIPPGAPSYVERASDHQVLQCLRDGEFCHVLTPRQMGKSSLMVRAALQLRREGRAVVRLDLTALGQNLTPEQWYDGLQVITADQLRCEDDFEEAWQRHARLGPCQRFFAVLRDWMRREPERSLVVFVDELDTVRSLPFSTDEFFAAVRACFNRRPDDPEFRRLTFCLLGVATPADLIRDPRITPFNIGRRVELHDFGPDEMRGLAAGMPFEERIADGVLKRVYHWTHGHPYLTQRLCQAIALDGRRQPSTSPAAGRALVDRLCGELFLSPSARLQDDNLQLLRERLLNSSANRTRVLNRYRRVRRGWTAVRYDETDPITGVLKLSGVVRVDGGRLRVRNRIYARAFDAAWIDASMPDVERRLQRAAFWRGVLRATAVSVLVLSILAGVGYSALYQYQRRQQQTVRLHLAQGNYRMERGDPLGGLPHFLEALERLQRMTSDRASEEITRLCLGAILRDAPVLHRFLPHESGIATAAMFPDGRKVATADDGGNVQIWDLESGRTNEARLHPGFDVTALLIDGAGGTLVMRGNESRLLVGGRLEGGQLHSRWTNYGVRGADLVRDRLVAGHTNGILARIELESGRATALHRHEAEVSHLAIAATAPRVACCVGGNTLWVHDLDTGRPVAGPLKLDHPQFDVAISPDGEAVAACGAMSAAILWRLDRPGLPTTRLPHLDGSTVWVFSIGFSDDGTRLVTAGSDCNAMIWDALDGRRLAVLHHDHDVYRAVFGPGGHRVATTGADGAAVVWNASEGTMAMPPLYHATFVIGALFGPDGRRVLTYSKDRSVRVWDPPPTVTRGAATVATRLSRPVETLASPRARRGVIIDVEGSAEVLDLADPPRSIAKLERRTPSLPGRSDLGGDGSRLVLATESGSLEVWDCLAGRRITTLPGPAGGPITLTLGGADGSRLAALGSGGDLLLAEIREGGGPAAVHVAEPGPDHETTRLAFGPDGRTLAVARLDGQVRLLDAVTGLEVARHVVKGAAGLEPSKIIFRPDGSPLLAVAFTSGRLEPAGVLLWRYRETSEKDRARWLPHWDGVLDVDFNPQGTVVATASEDGTVAIWDADTGVSLAPAYRGRHQAVSVTFSDPDGLLLFALWPRDLGGRLFDVRTLEPVGPPVRFADRPLAARFLPGRSRRLLVTFRNAAPRLLTLPQEGRTVAELERQTLLLAPRFARPTGGTLGPDVDEMYRTWLDLRSTAPRPDADASTASISP